METATSKMRDKQEEDILNHRIADFVERWMPEDRREASLFHAELHSIVRAIYADMQKPVTACLETVMMASSHRPVIFGFDKE